VERPWDSADVLRLKAPSAADWGDRNSAAEGRRGICSLALPSSAVGLLGVGDSGDKKLCRRMSSLDGPLRRNKPGMSGMIRIKP
jgi:hypothetical protein